LQSFGCFGDQTLKLMHTKALFEQIGLPSDQLEVFNGIVFAGVNPVIGTAKRIGPLPIKVMATSGKFQKITCQGTSPLLAIAL
jgi:hypothetical protein